MTGTILLATDLTDQCHAAFTRARQLAGSQAARLVVLHALGPSGADAADARAQLEQLAASANGPAPAALEIVVAPGPPEQLVRDQAGAREASLIVVGRHRALKLDRFRATTMTRLLHATSQPLLAVHAVPTGPYRRVLVATDFSPLAHAAWRFALNAFPAAELHLVHALDVPAMGLGGGQSILAQARVTERRRLEAFAAEDTKRSALDGRTITHLAEGPAREALRDLARRLPADLLVLGSHGRTGAAKLLYGSVAEDLLRDPPTDLLVLRRE